MQITKGNHAKGTFTISLALDSEEDINAVSLTATPTGYTSLSLHFSSEKQRQRLIEAIQQQQVTTFD